MKKASSKIFLLLMLTVMFFSCGEEDTITCYSCEGTAVTTFEICENSIELGDTISVEEFVSTFETLNGTCVKK